MNAKNLASSTVLASAWSLKLEHSANEDKHIPLQAAHQKPRTAGRVGTEVELQAGFGFSVMNNAVFRDIRLE